MTNYNKGDWRWEASIGLRYGYYKGKSVVRIHQPVMTSPWWTLSADDDREDFVRIYPSELSAALAAEKEYEGDSEALTLDEAKTLLKEAAHLLQDARPDGTDPGNNRQWGRRRKALVNRAIDAEVY